MTQRTWLVAGLTVLAVSWLGPLPRLAPTHFSAHMAMHMAVVAIAAPLLAFGAAGGRFDPACRWPSLFGAIPASLVELMVIWGWHAPALHQVARGTTAGLVAEQGSFAVAAFAVWISAFGGNRVDQGGRAGQGVVALLLTSMHMTLLGALIALSPRALYGHGAPLAIGPALLEEQEVGGAIMLAVGGLSYLGGGLWLTARLLRLRSGGVTAGGSAA